MNYRNTSYTLLVSVRPPVNRKQAKALIRHITSPAVAAIIKAQGLDPLNN
jgi:hypothetical protein